MIRTWHGRTRMQQRGIPPLVVQWLEEFGAERHDGRGAVIRYFDKRARRALERAVGREPVRRMSEFLDAYAVVGNDGALVTIGHRYARVKH